MPLDREAYFDRWASLHGGYDPRSSRLARWWLSAVVAVAVRCSRLDPSLVTAAGLLCALAVPLTATVGWPAVGLVLASGFLDSLDGAVAIVSGRDSQLGYVLDSVADRIADSAFVAALWVLGAPGWLCVAGGGLAWLQEYARARAGAAGVTAIVVVTIWERPTRILLTGCFLAAAAVVAQRADAVVATGAAAWVVFGVIGTGQALWGLRRELRS